MQFRRLFPFVIIIFVTIFNSCVTAPELKVFPTEKGAMYFIPPTEWKTETNDIAHLDITYHTGIEKPAVVNITFVGKKTMPRRVTSCVLNGADMEYPLANIKAMFADSRKREARVTTEADQDILVSMLLAGPMTLTAEIDGVSHTYKPNKKFDILRDDFSVTISFK